MKKQPHRTLVFALLGAGVVFLASSLSTHAGILDDLFGGFGKSARETSVAPPPSTLYKPAVDYEANVVDSVERNAPSVISIIITKDLPVIENCRIDPFNNLPPEFRDFFGPFPMSEPCQKGTRSQEIGGGSGFIVSKDGLIVTNKHVVADEAASYTVLLNDSTKLNAKVIARDPAEDLAIIKIESSNDLPVVTLGNSDGVKLGQTAIAIGNALGEFRNTVSVGIISGLARSIDAGSRGETEHLEGLIQTDAAINPGNSGGPLLNLRGEVIGINTAVAEGAQNIGFAIPVNRVKRDLESVKQTGKISSPFLGVRYLVVNPDIAKRDKLPVTEGVIIRGNNDGPGVLPSSPAAKAGIQAEDIIVSVNNEKITANQTLSTLIQKYRVGDVIEIKVLRNGKELKLKATLVERNS